MDVNEFLQEAKSRLIKLSNGDFVMKEEDLLELETMLAESNAVPGPIEKWRPQTFAEVSARAKRNPIFAEGNSAPSSRET